MTRRAPAARSVLTGVAEGPLVATNEALSFWGGVDHPCFCSKRLLQAAQKPQPELLIFRVVVSKYSGEVQNAASGNSVASQVFIDQCSAKARLIVSYASSRRAVHQQN
jgi:hypothetical protein